MAEIYDFPALIKSSSLPISEFSNRQKIEVIEYFMRKNCVDESPGFPLHHFVCNGVYYRELTIPEGQLIVGKVHAQKHISICLDGDISVMTNDGMKRIQGPFVMESEPGMKRIGYAHKTTRFATIHPTELTDIKEIENTLFYDSDLSYIDAYLGNQGDACLLQQ